MRLSGLFVTLEGVEGSGKSTQAALLREALEERGYPVIAAREPGGTRLGEAVRDILLSDAEAPTPAAELLLFLAARAQLVQRVILPALQSRRVVVCDRFADSTMAYQGYARGLNRALVAQMNAFATGGLMPDLTILLDLDPAAGLERQQERNRMERESLAFHQRVREGFLAAAAEEKGRFLILDATATRDELHEAILSRVLEAARKAGIAPAGPAFPGGES